MESITLKTNHKLSKTNLKPISRRNSKKCKKIPEPAKETRWFTAVFSVTKCVLSDYIEVIFIGHLLFIINGRITRTTALCNDWDSAGFVCSDRNWTAKFCWPLKPVCCLHYGHQTCHRTFSSVRRQTCLFSTARRHCGGFMWSWHQTYFT